MLAGVYLDYLIIKTLKDKVEGNLSATAQIAVLGWITLILKAIEGPAVQRNEAECADTIYTARLKKSPASQNSSQTRQEHTWFVYDVHRIC